MSRNHFGTDGVRGTVGASPMTADFVLRLGYAAGKVLSGQGEHPSGLIGKGTRISGYMIEAALEAGLSAPGVEGLPRGPPAAPGGGHPPPRPVPPGRGGVPRAPA